MSVKHRAKVKVTLPQTLVNAEFQTHKSALVLKELSICIFLWTANQALIE